MDWREYAFEIINDESLYQLTEKEFEEVDLQALIAWHIIDTYGNDIQEEIERLYYEEV